MITYARRFIVWMWSLFPVAYEFERKRKPSKNMFWCIHTCCVSMLFIRLTLCQPSWRHRCAAATSKKNFLWTPPRLLMRGKCMIARETPWSWKRAICILPPFDRSTWRCNIIYFYRLWVYLETGTTHETFVYFVYLKKVTFLLEIYTYIYLRDGVCAAGFRVLNTSMFWTRVSDSLEVETVHAVWYELVKCFSLLDISASWKFMPYFHIVPRKAFSQGSPHHE